MEIREGVRFQKVICRAAINTFSLSVNLPITFFLQLSITDDEQNKQVFTSEKLKLVMFCLKMYLKKKIVAD